MATLRLFFASAKNVNKSEKRNGDGADGCYGGDAEGAGDVGDALDEAGELGDAPDDAEDDGDAADDASSEDSQS